MPIFAEIKDYAGKNKKRIYLGGLIILIIFLALAIAFSSSSGRSKSSTTGNSSNRNPLIDNKEVENTKKDIDNSTNTKTVQVKYKFKYELNPSLKSESSFNIFSKAFAADPCGISNLPSTVTAYKLKTHYSSDEAQKFAGIYSVDPSTLSSIPDGSTNFEYYFSDPKSSSYLKLTEPSGTSTYHSANVTPGASNIDQGEAKSMAENALNTHSLNMDLTLKSSSVDGSSNNYIFSYVKNFPLKLVDAESIKEVGKVTSVCDSVAAKDMNYIGMEIGQKGDLSKLVNKTRLVLSSYTFDRESLDSSLAEYKDSPPIDPIVIGSSSTTATVTIDSVQMVYFDYGELYAQEVYMPVYLTSGKTSSGARVFTLFPTVSGSTLDKSPISPKTFSTQNLQVQTFNPAPPPPAGKLCYGNQVDYDLKCQSQGQVVCSGYVSISTSKGDPLGVCSTGCISKTGDVNSTSSDDPCSQFMIQNGLDGNYGDQTGVKSKHGIPNFPGGSVSCVLHGCPC